MTGAPVGGLGLILRGSQQLNDGLGVPVGDGLLCTSGSSARSQVQLCTVTSTVYTDFQGQPFGAPSYGPGVAANYQSWFRDQWGACSGAGFNFSNAWTVTWQP